MGLNFFERYLVKKTLQHLLSHWPAHLAWVFPVAAFFYPSLHAWEAAHPKTLAAQIIGIVLSLLARYGYGLGAPLKILTLSAVLALAGSPAWAQTSPAPQVQNIYAGGVSWNQSATPAVAGTALYAHAVDSSGTYAFTAVDVLPTSVKPFTVTTNVGVGIAQKLFSIGKVPIFVPTTAGVSWSGTNTGWAWSTGALASIKLGAKKNWRFFPMFRVARSNVSSGSGVQPIIGVAFGWGQ